MGGGEELEEEARPYFVARLQKADVGTHSAQSTLSNDFGAEVVCHVLGRDTEPAVPRERFEGDVLDVAPGQEGARQLQPATFLGDARPCENKVVESAHPNDLGQRREEKAGRSPKQTG